MTRWWISILSCFTFLSFVLDANAIKCYQCRSEDGQCTFGECSIDGGVCTKREKNYGNGTWTVIKTCRGAAVVNRTCEYDQTLGPDGRICFCDSEDFCNGAWKLRTFKWTSVLSVIITLSLSLALKSSDNLAQ